MKASQVIVVTYAGADRLHKCDIKKNYSDMIVHIYN